MTESKSIPHEVPSKQNVAVEPVRSIISEVRGNSLYHVRAADRWFGEVRTRDVSAVLEWESKGVLANGPDSQPQGETIKLGDINSLAQIILNKSFDLNQSHGCTARVEVVDCDSSAVAQEQSYVLSGKDASDESRLAFMKHLTQKPQGKRTLTYHISDEKRKFVLALQSGSSSMRARLTLPASDVSEGVVSWMIDHHLEKVRLDEQGVKPEALHAALVDAFGHNDKPHPLSNVGK